jgi:hypothetical protein
MKSILPAALLAVALPAAAQLLTCPPPASPAQRACDLFHYHVAMYRPDTRGFLEVWGTNQFASQSACDRTRDAAMKRNLAVVDHMKRVANDSNFEPDRFGACHCDGSIDKSSSTYLNDAQRTVQLRNAEEIRQRVRERLLDSGLTSDAELVRSLIPPPVANPLIGGPRLVPPPQSAPVAALGAASDLKTTKAIDTSKPSTATVDLPLVDIGAAPPPAPGPSPGRSTSSGPTSPAATGEGQVATTPSPAAAGEGPRSGGEGSPLPTTTVAPDEPDPSAEEAADAFISYETQRIQNVLKAASAIADESVKSKIFEACLQRTQLLSNLRALILGAGSHSKLAAISRSAHNEQDRIAFATALFGRDIAPHWAPKDATDVIIDGAPDDPERILRDKQAADAEKRRALYFFLARAQPTDEQQLWLSNVIDGFLQ